jgi:hypothetical protein
VLVAVPTGVVTAMGPFLAALGTVAVIWESDATTKVAATPSKVTELVPVNPEPVIVTLIPTGPLVGEKLLIVGAPGAEVTVKLVALVAVPPGVVTLIFPVVAPAGTVAVIRESEATLNVAATFLNLTELAPLKPVPLIVTLVPTGPLVGEKLLMVGATAATVTVKLAALVAVPPPVVTLMGPDVAPVGTVAVIRESEFKMKAPSTSLNLTEVAPVKPEPLIVTLVPTGPLVGEKLPIVGETGDVVTVKFVALVAVPALVVILMGPVVPALGTVAVICVSEPTL